MTGMEAIAKGLAYLTAIAGVMFLVAVLAVVLEAVWGTFGDWRRWRKNHG